MLLTKSSSTNVIDSSSLRLLTVREYNLMAQVGILTNDEKVE
ncbi:hypothetical protein ACN4EE_09280 [Geminocystis sp. CENA526]